MLATDLYFLAHAAIELLSIYHLTPKEVKDDIPLIFINERL